MMKIKSVRLYISGNSTILAVVGDGFDRGKTAVEMVPTATPKQSTLDHLRKSGEKRAKMLNVPFADETT